MAQNRVIGINNQLPWHLPADLQHFKRVTSGHAILMGRKTFASIGRPLPNRQNIILTHDYHFTAPGCEVIHDIAQLAHFKDVFIIGGSSIYTLLWPQISRLYLTLVHANVAGDAYFPEIDFSHWHEVSREDHVSDKKNAYDYSFLLLER